MNKKFLAGKIYVLVIAVAIASGVLVWKYVKPAPEAGKYDAFAQCLSQKHAVMYGAYWCPHCKNQKELFGSAWEYVLYEECAIRGSRELTQACIHGGVTRFPTWIFADDSRVEGEMSLNALGEKTDCALPNGNNQ